MNSFDVAGGVFLSYFAKEDVSDTRETSTFDRDNYYYFNQNFRPFQKMLTLLFCFPYWLILMFFLTVFGTGNLFIGMLLITLIVFLVGYFIYNYNVSSNDDLIESLKKNCETTPIKIKYGIYMCGLIKVDMLQIKIDRESTRLMGYYQ
jgi:hypothetical protein